MNQPGEASLCAELQDLCAKLSGSGGTSAVRLQAVLAQVFPKQAAQHGILDPKLEAYSEAFFQRLIQAEVDAQAGAGLILFRSDRFAEVCAQKGPQTADQLLGQLAEFLRPRLRAAEALGRIGSDALALLLPQAGLLTAQERGQDLHDALRRSSRFPVSTGVAHTRDLSGGAAELVRLAAQAAEQTRQAADRRVRTLTAQGPVAAPPTAAPPAPAEAGGSSLAARYQRLVLLNRMSLELLSDKPFAEALGGACSTALALTGAKYVAVHFCDESGRPALAHRHGDPPAAPEEEALVERALRERRILTAPGAAWSWVAAPLLHHQKDGPAEDGALVLGYPELRAPDPELDQTVLEISRLLRNARLAQKHVEHQRVLAAVTEQSADAIYITDLESRVTSWNAAAEELFQYRREEALGQTVHFLVPQERLQELDELDARTRREGCSKNFETVRLRRDGSRIPVEGTCFLLRDEKSQPFGTVRVFRDITRRKEIDRMKSEFVSLVSHELRTPLTAIQGFTETIFDFWDELQPEQRRHYLGIILAESQRLGKLVTNFLDISRLEAGGVALKPARVDLPDLARRAAALFKDHPGRVTFEVDFAPESEKAWADADQLYRVLINLCGNAVKYSPAGGAVKISGRPAGSEVEVSVQDAGPGIPPEARAKLFTKFYRVGDPISRKTPGTGLGLAICKSIVEGHGGKICVESVPGQGAVFKFTLPREALKPA